MTSNPDFMKGNRQSSRAAGHRHREDPFESIFDLAPGAYVTNNILGGYDFYEEVGPCENRCVMCTDVGKTAAAPGLPLEAFIRRGRERRNGRILLCTGEPTGIEDLPEKVRLLRGGYGGVALVTNGRRLGNRRFLEDLVEAGISDLFVSLHGRSAGLHEGVTRAPGSFDETLAGLRNALDLEGSRRGRVNVAVNTVVTARTLGEMGSFVDFLLELPVTAVCFSAVIPMGLGRDHFRDGGVRYGEMLEAFTHAVKRGRRRGRYASLRAVLLFVPLCLRALADPGRPAVLHSRKLGEFRRLSDPRLEARCAACRCEPYCEGIFTDYAARFGLDEFDAGCCGEER